MVNVGSKSKTKKSPKKSPEEKIKDIDIALNTSRKSREKLTEMEEIFLSKMFQAYLRQYPLITKGKKPDRYAHNHKMAESLEKKMIRMKIIKERE